MIFFWTANDTTFALHFIISELRLQLADSKGPNPNPPPFDMWTDNYCKISYLCITLH